MTKIEENSNQKAGVVIFLKQGQNFADLIWYML
jgi:hypothetical protein